MHAMNDSIDTERQQAWSSYWAAGALHSCADSFQGNYSGAIAEFWRPRFQSLPPQCRVLDLATGNGALPLLLWELTHGQSGMQVDAVDLAQVTPAWYRPDRHAGIAFHSGVAMERLPFEDATFDMVVSQFGLEYAQWPQALHEVLRVARPRGAAAFVMHHPDSIIVRVGRHELKNLGILLSPDGVLDAARRVLPWIVHARAAGNELAANPEASASKQAYNLAMTRIGEEIEASPVPDLLIEMRASVHALLSGVAAGGSAAPLQELEKLKHALRAAELRAAELVAHAVDRQRLDGLVEIFQASRPMDSIVCEPLAQEQGIIGWGVRLQRQTP